MRRILCRLWWSATLITTIAGAQSFGNPAGLSADTPGIETGSPKADHANSQDKLFVRQAALAGQAEVELGKLSQKKSASDAVKQFAERMIADHSKSAERVARLGRDLNDNIPKQLDTEHRLIREQLDQWSAKDFDMAYLTSQIQDHQKAANLLLWELSMGQNEALKTFAAEQLPMILDHLEMAKLRYAELTSTAPPR